MTMTCSICNNKNKLEIDRKLAQGISYQKIANEYGVSAQSVRNHAMNHLSHQLVGAWQKKEALESLDILSEIEDLLRRTKAILTKAEDKKNYNLALNAIKEARGSYELLSKIAFALHQSRIAELQIEQEKNQNISAENDAEFNEGLHRLSDAELILFEMLVDKVHGLHKEPILKGGRYLGGGEKWFKMEDLTDKAREEIDWYHSSKKGPLEDDKPDKSLKKLSEESTPTLDIDPYKKNDSRQEIPRSAEVKTDEKTMRRTKYPKKYVVQETPPDKKKVYPRSDDLSPPFEYGASKRPKQTHREAVPFSSDPGLRIKEHKVRND